MTNINRDHGTTRFNNSSTSTRTKTTTVGRNRDRSKKMVDYTKRGKVISQAESFGLQEYLRATTTTSSSSSSFHNKQARRRSTSRSFPRRRSSFSSSKIRSHNKLASRTTIILEKKKSALRPNDITTTTTTTTNPAILRPQKLSCKSWNNFHDLETLDLDLKKNKKFSRPLVIDKDITTDILSDMSQSTISDNSNNGWRQREKGCMDDHIQFFFKIPARKDRYNRGSDLRERFPRVNNGATSSSASSSSSQQQPRIIRGTIRSMLMRDLSFSRSRKKYSK